MTTAFSSYTLPQNSATITPHTTERCWRTANQNLVLLTEVGSRLHGNAVGGDDQDMQGVCIEPPKVMLGTSEFKLYEYRTQPQGARSGKDDLDLSVYGLSKWVRLIIAGNPSHLLPLFAPAAHTFALAWPGEELRENKHLFLAREHSTKFLGYLNRQRERMLGNLSQRTNRPELIAQHGYDCYLDDTEFLTRRGWLHYDDIDGADQLGTINQATGHIEFQQATERVAKSYSGPILTNRTRYSEWAVTPNHRMRVSSRYRGPSGTGEGAYDPRIAAWQFRPASEITTLQWHQQVTGVPSEVEFPVSDAHLALIGAYVSEGCVGKRLKDGSASQLRFEQKDGGRLHAYMEMIATEYPLRTYRYKERRPVTLWTLADRTVASEIAKSCGEGSVHKRLPEWTLKLSGRQADILIGSMMSGDGTPYRSGGWVYYSISKKLAGDVQALALIAGRRANVRGPYEPAAIYQVLIHDSGDTPYAPLQGRHIQQINVVDRRIVCFTVPNETLVTRRNGHVAMHGNTKFASHALRIAVQGAQLMRTGEIPLPMRPEHRKYLTDVRLGHYTQGEVLSKLGMLEEDLLTAANSSSLPAMVDTDYINDWICSVYQKWWKEQGLV